MFKHITRTVWLLSIISLMNDFSSEMLYPVIPLFLQQSGYGTALIGILEGVAELIAGLSKIYMGRLSDTFQRRLPFVQVGYTLSILSRPLIGMTTRLGLIFAGRSMDKIGKGIRTGARDALLADESHAANRAEVFGFHRSMDTLGAVLGPLLAMLYLSFHPQDYRSLFFITLFPGIIAALCTALIREKQHAVAPKQAFSLSRNFGYYRKASPAYLKLTGILLLFGLVNSSDMFLLIRAKECGMSETQVILLYIAFNLVYALMAFPIGKMADRFGRKRMLVSGLMVYTITYAIFGFTHQALWIVAGFISYGLYYAFTQGAMKALLLEQVEKPDQSGAIGFYEGLNSFSLLLGNALAGWIWYRFGHEAMFSFSALVVMGVIAFLFFTCRKRTSV